MPSYPGLFGSWRDDEHRTARTGRPHRDRSKGRAAKAARRRGRR